DWSRSVTLDSVPAPPPATSIEPAISSSQARRDPRKPAPPVITTFATVPPAGSMVGVYLPSGPGGPPSTAHPCSPSLTCHPRKATIAAFSPFSPISTPEACWMGSINLDPTTPPKLTATRLPAPWSHGPGRERGSLH